MQKDKSFTIVELLVVIALIGLLASIVFVYLKDAREKARIASTLEFSSSLYHALGADIVGYWNFNDGTAKDTSGYNNDGTINGAIPASGLPDLGGAVSFDGSNDFIDCGNDESLQITSSFTVEGWMYMNDDYPNPLVAKDRAVGGDRGWYFSTVGIGDTRLRFVISSDGTNVQFLTTTNSLNLYKWYHLVAVYNASSQTLKIYVNGTEWIGTLSGGTVPASIYNTSQSVHIAHSSSYANGLIDEVRIYNTALISVQIQQYYAEGLEKHKDLVIK